MENSGANRDVRLGEVGVVGSVAERLTLRVGLSRDRGRDFRRVDQAGFSLSS